MEIQINDCSDNPYQSSDEDLLVNGSLQEMDQEHLLQLSSQNYHSKILMSSDGGPTNENNLIAEE